MPPLLKVSHVLITWNNRLRSSLCFLHLIFLLIQVFFIVFSAIFSFVPDCHQQVSTEELNFACFFFFCVLSHSHQRTICFRYFSISLFTNQCVICLLFTGFISNLVEINFNWFILLVVIYLIAKFRES